MKSFLRRWLPICCAMIVGGFFIVSGYLKAIDPGAFVQSVRSFDLLPDPYAAWMAMFLPWLELLAGAAALTGVLRRGGLLVINLSLIVFLIAICISWARGLDLHCGCFGDSAGAVSDYVELIVRDLLLLAVGITALCIKGRSTVKPIIS